MVSEIDIEQKSLVKHAANPCADVLKEGSSHCRSRVRKEPFGLRQIEREI